MELSEFLNRGQESAADVADENGPEEIDVQKAVVESLAADKAEQDEVIDSLRKENEELKAKVKLLRDELARMGDMLTKNVDGEMSNKISILDRNLELDDRFEGETRDQVIEVLREGRDEAERNGRLRRAQILEAVLVENEPSGELAKRRGELVKLFADNANIINGTVIEELEKRGISHKNGENYLLTSEIIKRNY